MASTIRIGQFTGWHGDRADGMTELLATGVDVLTGDYLAELTMLVLHKNQQRGGPGYVGAFADLLGQHLGEIAQRGVKVVTNAGGLDAPGLASVIRTLCTERGVDLSVASVTGDDMTAVLSSGDDHKLVNIDTGETLDLATERVLTANAYLGAWPIVAALEAGADIVVCPRMTDASLIVGPAAWHFGWSPEDLDRLAGAVVAGHVIECGAQATGGNFSYFFEHDDLGLPGMPIAEIASDGSCVITKSSGSGGLVSVDTILAQLFYEVGGQAYLNPDVLVDLATVQVSQLSADRVQISGTRGLPPTSTTKLSLTYEGGYRSTMTIGLTGGHLERKRAWLQRQVHAHIGPPESFDECRWSLVGPADPHGNFEEATAWLVLTVRDRDRDRVDRTQFANRIVEIATSNIPGFYMTTPPQAARLFGVQWPALVDKQLVRAIVQTGSGDAVSVDWPSLPAAILAAAPSLASTTVPVSAVTAGAPTTTAPLGSIVGTRSGDKAGSANIGVWARDDATFAWSVGFLTIDRLNALAPELRDLRVERTVLPNLRGMNFVVYQYLGDGVSACTRIDPQGKGLGEYLGNRLVEVPTELLA